MGEKREGRGREREEEDEEEEVRERRDTETRRKGGVYTQTDKQTHREKESVCLGGCLSKTPSCLPPLQAEARSPIHLPRKLAQGP